MKHLRSLPLAIVSLSPNQLEKKARTHRTQNKQLAGKTFRMKAPLFYIRENEWKGPGIFVAQGDVVILSSRLSCSTKTWRKFSQGTIDRCAIERHNKNSQTLHRSRSASADRRNLLE